MQSDILSFLIGFLTISLNEKNMLNLDSKSGIRFGGKELLKDMKNHEQIGIEKQDISNLKF
ncbi:hypothetical protein ES705_34663 [subsurface metagenome]